VVRVASDEARAPMVQAGLQRARDFSWKLHVERIVELVHSLTDSSASSSIYS